MHLMNKETEEFFSKFKPIVERFYKGGYSEEELVTLQNEKLNSILEYVYNHSKFYKSKLEEHSDKFGSLTIDNMQSLPFTTKDDLREADIDILSQPMNNNAYYYETTGTTGKATPCPRSIIDVIASNVTISLAYKHVFESVFGDEKPVVGVFGPTEVHSFGDTLGNVCHNLDLCVVKAWPYSPVIGFEKSLELIKKADIQVLMCTPGLAMTLLKAAKTYGFDVKKDFNVKMLMLTGEMCTEPMVKNIEALWGAKVYNFLYGSQEALVMASCNKDNRMNIFPHNYIYELIEPGTDKFIGFEGEGELTVTMLNPGGKPLIRYRTGDIVRINKRADSALPSKEIEIMGRVKDSIYLNDKPVKASILEELIMKDISNCLGYQIVIDNRDGKDVLEIALEMLEKEYRTDEILNNIKDRFVNALNIEANVSFSDELNPVIYTGALVSWKAARIIDKRKTTKEFEKIEKNSAEKVITDKIIRVR